MSLAVECWELLSAQKTWYDLCGRMKDRELLWNVFSYWILCEHIYVFVRSFHSYGAFSWSVEVDRCMHSLLVINSISSLRQISHSHLSSRMNGKLRRDEKRVAPSILFYTLYSFSALIRRWRWFSSALDPPYGLLFHSYYTELTRPHRVRMATIKPIRKIKFMIFIRGRRSLMISCAVHYV